MLLLNKVLQRYDLLLKPQHFGKKKCFGSIKEKNLNSQFSIINYISYLCGEN
jgi:hypothetical protein